MQYTTLFTAATLAASALAAPAPVPAAEAAPLKLYKIKTEPHNSKRTEFSQYLESFHTGAGTSALVATKDAAKATKFAINGTVGAQLVIYQGRSDIPNYAVNLTRDHADPAYVDAPTSYNYITVGRDHADPAYVDAPTSYNYITATVGYAGSKGFFVNSEGNLIFEGVKHKSDLQSFALCHVNATLPYPSLGPQYQLFWEAQDTKPEYAKCADVKLQAIRAN